MADLTVGRLEGADLRVGPTADTHWVSKTFDAFQFPTYRVLWTGTITVLPGVRPTSAWSIAAPSCV